MSRLDALAEKPQRGGQVESEDPFVRVAGEESPRVAEIVGETAVGIGEAPQQLELRPVVGAQFHEAPGEGCGFLVLPHELKRTGEMLVIDSPQRVDFDRSAIFLDRFVEVVRDQERLSQPAVIFRSLRAQLDCLAIIGNRALLVDVEETHRRVGVTEVRIELHGLSGQWRRFCPRPADRQGSVGRRVIRPKHQHLRQLGIGRCVVRVELDGLLQKPFRFLEGHVAPVTQELPGGKVTIVDFRVGRAIDRFAEGPRETGRHGLSNVALQSENVAKLTLIALGPHLLAVRNSRQRHDYEDAAAGSPNTSVEQVGDAEIPRGFERIGAICNLLRRNPPEHANRPLVRKQVQYLVGHA